MTTYYAVTYDCGHRDPPRKFLPLFQPHENGLIYCHQCGRRRLVIEVTSREIPDPPKRKRTKR